MFKDLNNSEISLVYYQFRDHLQRLNSELDLKLRSERIDIHIEDFKVTPLVLITISDEEVAAIRSSHYYQTIVSIVEKLKPIVELIEEAEPHIKTELDE
jgi:hypothetical protein